MSDTESDCGAAHVAKRLLTRLIPRSRSGLRGCDPLRGCNKTQRRSGLESAGKYARDGRVNGHLAGVIVFTSSARCRANICRREVNMVAAGKRCQRRFLCGVANLLVS